MSPVFISTADEKYVDVLKVSIRQALKLYPDSTFYVYDWGIEKESVESIRSISKHIEIIPWELKIVDLPVKFSGWIFYKRLFQLHSLRTVLSNLLKKRTLIFPKKIYDWIVFEMKIYNKFLCIKHFNDTYKTNFIFLDADAFIINTFDELFDSTFDVGVTVRPKIEWSFRYNDCTILNVGVLFFLGTHTKNTKLIDAWHTELDTTREINCEQTALTRLLHKHKLNIFEDTKSVQIIKIGNSSIRIRVLPCEKYNYNWIEKFDLNRDADTVNILHLKSGRFRTSLFTQIANKLNIEL